MITRDTFKVWLITNYSEQLWHKYQNNIKREVAVGGQYSSTASTQARLSRPSAYLNMAFTWANFTSEHWCIINNRWQVYVSQLEETPND